MNKLNYLSVRGQGHSLVFAKGHLVFKVKSCFSKKKVLGYLSIYLSFHTASPPREDYVQVDCDLKSKCKNRKKKFETKYYVKGYGSTRMKIYAHLGHMVKMVATPIYGKNHSKNLLRNQWADCSET